MTTRIEFEQRNKDSILSNDSDFENYRIELEKEIKVRGILLYHRFYTDFSKDSLPRFIFVIKKILKSFGIFISIHYISREIWKRITPKLYYSLSKQDKIYLPQKICSTIHGSFVGFWALKIILIDGVFQRNRKLEWYPIHGDDLYSTSLGYELYDLFTMYNQGSSQKEMWAHHFSLISCYILEMWYRKVYSITTTMMVTELTVIPGNLHWYLKLFNVRNSFIFKGNKIFRLLMFLILRLIAGPFVFYGIFIKQRRQYIHHHWFLKVIAYGFPIFLTYLNWNWTYQIVKLFYLQNKKRNIK